MSSDTLTVRAIRARPVDVPMARPMRTAVGTIPTAPLVLIDVVTEQGVTGRSHFFGYTPVTLAPLTALFANIAPMLVGKPVSAIWRRPLRPAPAISPCRI